jgi:signal transduction histidine kinase
VVSDAVRRTCGSSASRRSASTWSAGDLLDWWDASAVDQIVHNLLWNAVQYADGRPCSVKVDRAAGALRVRVTDSGGGISAAAHARLFRRRIGPRSAGASGQGMGLWLVRELAEAHGGSATVESRKVPAPPSPSAGATAPVSKA